MNKLIFLLFTCALLLSPAIEAARLTPEQALSNALLYQDKNTSVILKQFAATPQGNFELCTSDNIALTFPDTYLFQRKGGAGFLILSADDRFAPILAYSETGSFDSDQMPSGLQYMLEFYNNEIRNSSPAESDNQAYKVDCAIEVAPLLNSTWGQQAPYNSKLQQIFTGDLNAPYVTPPTGCNATAMAQVMRYHRWPSHGAGQYENVSFDWDNMIDSYQSEYTEEQAVAVGTLMKICGESISTIYNRGSSSAYPDAIDRALGDCFFYEKSTLRTLRRGYDPMSEILAAIYGELKAGRPIIVAARSTLEGHTFVLDGCDSDGYFHINWGWDGYGNGFFRLSAMKPGADPDSDTYNDGQEFHIGIQKSLPEPGDYPKGESCIYAAGDLYLYREESQFYTTGDVANLGFNDFLNLSSQHQYFWFGFKVVSESTGEISYIIDTDKFYSQEIRPHNYSKINYHAYLDDIPSGSKVYLVYKTTPDDTPKEIKYPLGSIDYFIVDSNGRFENPHKDSNLNISNVTLPKEIPFCNIETLAIDIANFDSDYYHGQINAEIFDNLNEKICNMGSMMCSLAPGESDHLEVEWEYELESGAYTVVLSDRRGRQVCEPINFSIVAPVRPDVVKINKENFPDEGLRSYLSRYDSNNDGYITPTENKYILHVNLTRDSNFDYEVKSLKGLQKLTSLNTLFCQNQLISELDISDMPSLTDIDVIGCPLVSFIYGNNHNLNYLNLNESPLASLELADLPSLETLYLQYGKLETLKLNDCYSLKTINMYDSNLKQVDISGCYQVEGINMSENHLKNIDLRDLTNLRVLKIENNELQAIDLSCNENLNSLWIRNNNLAWLDLSSNQHLVVAYLDGNEREVYTKNGKFDMAILEQEGLDYYRTNRFMNMGEDGRIIDFSHTSRVPYTFLHYGPSYAGNEIVITLINMGEDPTGALEDVTDESADRNSKAYDLLGRPQNNTEKGIFIINGKKQLNN